MLRTTSSAMGQSCSIGRRSARTVLMCSALPEQVTRVVRNASALGAGVCMGPRWAPGPRSLPTLSVLCVHVPYNKYVLLRVLAQHNECDHGAMRPGGE